MVKFFILVLTWSECLCGVDLSTQNQNLVQLRAKQRQNQHFCMLCKLLNFVLTFYSESSSIVGSKDVKQSELPPRREMAAASPCSS